MPFETSICSRGISCRAWRHGSPTEPTILAPRPRRDVRLPHSHARALGRGVGRSRRDRRMARLRKQSFQPGTFVGEHCLGAAAARRAARTAGALRSRLRSTDTCGLTSSRIRSIRRRLRFRAWHPTSVRCPRCRTTDLDEVCCQFGVEPGRGLVTRVCRNWFAGLGRGLATEGCERCAHSQLHRHLRLPVWRSGRDLAHLALRGWRARVGEARSARRSRLGK